MKVLIFTAYPWLNISTPLIESVQYFLKNNWEVIHFGIIHPGVDQHGHKKLEIESQNYKFITLGDTIKFRSNIKKILYSIFFFFKFRRISKNSNLILSFDPGSLYLSFAWLVFGRCRNRIYHSLEISNHKTRTFLLEKFVSSFTNLLLTQDKTRGRILRVILNYKSKIVVIPNSTSGEPIFTKKSFFHETLGIPIDKKILLMTGTIDEFTGSDLFLSLVPYLPKNWVAVIHGWTPSEKTKSKLNEIKNINPSRLYISSALVENRDKFDIFSSVDACFVYFKPDDLNLKYALYSAGKLFDSAKTGVSVVVNQIPGARTLINKYRLGYLLKGPEIISEILEKIADNKVNENSIMFYRENEFSKNYNFFLNEYCYLTKE
ncbi:hypothetical protein AB3N60_09980 [Leptospira sp. WS39.C2]